MCLLLSKNYNDEKQILRDKIKGGKKYFYKVYRIEYEDGNILLGPFILNKVEVVKGKILSDRNDLDLTSGEKIKRAVSFGIHVFCTRKGAESYKKKGEEQVFRVKCSHEDLVAVDDGYGQYGQQAVFTKITPADRKFKKYFPKLKLKDN